MKILIYAKNFKIDSEIQIFFSFLKYLKNYGKNIWFEGIKKIPKTTVDL